MMFPPCRRIGLLVALALALVSAEPAGAQTVPAGTPPPRPAPGQGMHAFRRLLHDFRPGAPLQPLQSKDQLAEEDPAGTLIIVLGELETLDQIPLRGGLREFLERGGAVLAATDRATFGGWERVLGAGVTGDEVKVPAEHEVAYRGTMQDCPIVRGFPTADPPVFQGALLKVATNRPSCLKRRSGALKPLAYFPLDAWAENAQGRQRRDAVLPFAVGGDLGNGRVLLLADHSVVINDMMLQIDNDNLLFAYNCIKWLTDSGKRDRVLFVEDGEVRTSFDVPLRQVPGPALPSVEALVPVANQLVSDLEDEDVFRKWIADEVPPWRTWQTVLLGLTAGVLFLGLMRLVRARNRVEAGAPLFERTLGRLAPASALMAERHQAMLHSGNLWEAARDLARQCLEGVGPAEGAPAATAPRISTKGPWWRTRSLRRQALHLWRLAYGDAPVRVSPVQFARLGEEAETIRAALANGTLRIDQRVN
jgi:hypothetical protein